MAVRCAIIEFMDYGRLLRDAWTITWRHRFLWLLGLFAGSSAGTCSGGGFNFNFPAQWNTSRGDGRDGTGGPNFQPIVGWINDNLGPLIALVLTALVVIVLIWLLFKVLSLISQGGMARATADIAAGRPSSLSQAIQAGMTYFWRFLGLWLLLVALTIVIGLSLAIFGATIVIVIAALPESIRFIPIILAVLVGIAALLVLIPASILFNIVVAFAQRAIVVEDIGPIAAIKSGARLLRSKLGASLIVWLINVAVSILGGLILVVAMVVTVVPLAIVGFLIYTAIGFGGPLIVYLVLACLVLIVVIWALSAVVNTYFWSYWTIAYLRLTGREVVV